MDESQSTPMRVLFGRVFWMFIGPTLLFVTTIQIVTNGTGWNTPTDYVYAVSLLGMLFARWIEFRAGNPLTCRGEPATWSDFYRYLWIVLIGGVVIWILANLFGNRGI